MQVSNTPCMTAGSSLSTLTVPQPWGGVCYHAETLTGGQTDGSGSSCNKSVTSSTPTVSGGTCTAGGGVAANATPTWGTTGKACKGNASGGGCADGKTCQPKPRPFESGLCVSQAGEVPCPDGLFQQQLVLYEDHDDGRACAGCACGQATGGSCTLSIQLFSNPIGSGCVTEVAKFDAGSCFDIQNNPDISGWSSQVAGAPSGGTCPKSGGSPTGTVTPSVPTTFCCVP